MALSLQSFNAWTQQQAAAIQASASQALNFTTGSVLRAIVEANASVALWFQWLLLQLLALTRAATSSGSDLDTWMADFSLTRLSAVAATGSVTFSRFSTGTAALIVPGAGVKTADGTQFFTVTTDTTNGAWSASLGGYSVGSSTTSVTVPVVATVAGTGGNVAAGSISVLTTSISGIDTVTNATALTNGVAAETDTALRTRFATYINTRARGTLLAIGNAIAGVQQGLTYSISENVTSGGAYSPGNFVVYVDDGSGSPSTSLKALVYAAVDAVRPIGTTFAVFGPTVVTANVAATITTASGYVHGNLTGPAQIAVTAYINALPMGSALPYSRLAQIIYDTSSGITNVTGITINSATADVGGTTGTVVRAGTVTVS